MLMDAQAVSTSTDHVEALPPKRRGEDSALNRNVDAVLSKTEFRRADTAEEFEKIARLRYKAYRATGLTGDIENEVIADSLDEAPNCFRYAVYIEGQLAGTLRIHHVTKEHPYSTAMNLFPDVLGPRLERGESFIDPGRFAADPEVTGKIRAMPYIILRIPTIAGAYFPATSCLSTVTESHAAFYERIFKSIRIGKPRAVNGLNAEVCLLESNYERNLSYLFDKYTFFNAKSHELEQLFGR